MGDLPHDLTLSVGANQFIMQGSGRVIGLRMNGRDMIVLDRSDNSISIESASVYSEDGRIVAEIINNAFKTNPETRFKIEEPDHGLVVFDQKNVPVLDVRYLNHSTVQIMGVFANDGDTLRITKDGIFLPEGLRLDSNDIIASVAPGGVLIDLDENVLRIGMMQIDRPPQGARRP